MPYCSVARASYSSNSSTVLLDGSKIYVWRDWARDYSTGNVDCKSLASWPGDRAYLVSYDSYTEVGECAAVAAARAACSMYGPPPADAPVLLGDPGSASD
jgi:hypothetical protein